MGGGQSVAPAVPDPSVVAMLQSAQQQDLQTTQSDLSGQTSALAQMFGSGTVYKQNGASMAGGLNGLSSVAFAPLGMSSPVSLPSGR